ncbi:hypothetical protein L249_4767, partial [Ophiocordyceps polyrhachis-furcata BCC 54312]
QRFGGGEKRERARVGGKEVPISNCITTAVVPLVGNLKLGPAMGKKEFLLPIRKESASEEVEAPHPAKAPVQPPQDRSASIYQVSPPIHLHRDFALLISITRADVLRYFHYRLTAKPTTPLKRKANTAKSNLTALHLSVNLCPEVITNIVHSQKPISSSTLLFYKYPNTEKNRKKGSQPTKLSKHTGKKTTCINGNPSSPFFLLTSLFIIKPDG